jgi:hypothetical protein
LETTKKANTITETDHKAEIIKLIKEAAYSKDISQVFNDFVEMGAIAIANTANFTKRQERENRYLDLINSYSKRHQGLFPEMLAQLVLALEERVQTAGTEDILGLIFHELELHSVYKGQFFTPQHISDFMALIACDDMQSVIAEKGYIAMNEPCCGSGVMITSFCKAMKHNNLNYHNQLVVTAVDIDLKCVHMTYLQLSLYGIPAVVIHGNTLTCEEWSRWYTPFYILNGWIWREHCGITTKFCIEDEMLKRASEPMYAAIRNLEPTMPNIADKTEPAETVFSNTGSSEQIQFDVDFEALKTPGKAILTPGKAEPKTQEFGEQINLFDVN